MTSVTLSDSIPDVVRNLIRLLGSQNAVAEVLGTSQSQVWKWKEEKANPQKRFHCVLRIADAAVTRLREVTGAESFELQALLDQSWPELGGDRPMLRIRAGDERVVEAIGRRYKRQPTAVGKAGTSQVDTAELSLVSVLQALAAASVSAERALELVRTRDAP